MKIFRHIAKLKERHSELTYFPPGFCHIYLKRICAGTRVPSCWLLFCFQCVVFWLPVDGPQEASRQSYCHFFVDNLSSLSGYFLKKSFFFFFLGPLVWHMEVPFPRLGIELELQLPAYNTATAMEDPSSVCHLHHSSWQCQILNPLSEVRDRTHILMDTRWVHYH